MDKIEKLLEDMNKKLDAIVLLNCIENLSGDNKLNLLKYSVGIKPAARILKKDKSGLKRSLKSKNKNAKK